MNSAAELWQRYQDWLYYHAELNFYVDISRTRFSADFVATMQPKFEKAFADMKALEAGAIANPDEDRMVGHYWLRAPELAPTESLKHDITSTLEKVNTFAKQVIKGEIHPPMPPNLPTYSRSALVARRWVPNLWLRQWQLPTPY
jgi:glucose-6-phosphate isomerase